MAATNVNSFTAGTFTAGVATISVTGVQTGDTIIVLGGWGFTDIVLTSIADGDGAYSQAETRDDAGSARAFIYYRENCSAGTHTVTITAASQPAIAPFFAQLVRGLLTSGSLDQHTNGGGFVDTSANSSTSGAVTPTTDGQYIVGFHFDSSGSINFTPGSDFTAAPTGAGNALSEYYVQPTAASHAALAQSSSGTAFGCMALVATFKAGASASDLSVNTIGEPVIGGSTF